MLTARAPARDASKIDWTIADGYYLYRHRTAVQVQGAGFDAQPLQLPAGTPYTDEFFGDVETYRQQLVATLPGRGRRHVGGAAGEVPGCADIGICYPPQTRTVSVRLPGAGRRCRAAPGGDASFAALGRAVRRDRDSEHCSAPDRADQAEHCPCRPNRPSCSKPSPATATRS